MSRNFWISETLITSWYDDLLICKKERIKFRRSDGRQLPEKESELFRGEGRKEEPEWRDDLCGSWGRESRGLHSCSPNSTYYIHCGGNRHGACIERRSLSEGEDAARAATYSPPPLPPQLRLPLAPQLPAIHQTPGEQKQIKSQNSRKAKKCCSTNQSISGSVSHHSHHDSSVLELHFYSQFRSLRRERKRLSFLERERGGKWWRKKVGRRAL